MSSFNKYILIGDISNFFDKKFYIRNTLNKNDSLFAYIEDRYFDSKKRIVVNAKRVELYDYIKNYNYDDLHSFSEFKDLIFYRDNICNDILPEGYISKDPEFGKYTIFISSDSDDDTLFLAEHDIDCYQSKIEISCINSYGRYKYINDFDYKELFSDSELYCFVKNNFFHILKYMKIYNSKKEEKYPKNKFWEIFLDLKSTHDIFI